MVPELWGSQPTGRNDMNQTTHISYKQSHEDWEGVRGEDGRWGWGGGLNRPEEAVPETGN